MYCEMCGDVSTTKYCSYCEEEMERLRVEKTQIKNDEVEEVEKMAQIVLVLKDMIQDEKIPFELKEKYIDRANKIMEVK